MADRESKLEWNVYYHDFNGRRITTYNVFNHGTLCKQLAKIARQRKKGTDGKRHSITKEEFVKELRSWMMYCYWSKAEWEVIIGPWIANQEAFDKESIKIDVFDQLSLNFDIFADYVWDHISEVRKLDKDLR